MCSCQCAATSLVLASEFETGACRGVVPARVERYGCDSDVTFPCHSIRCCYLGRTDAQTPDAVHVLLGKREFHESVLCRVCFGETGLEKQ